MGEQTSKESPSSIERERDELRAEVKRIKAALEELRLAALRLGNEAARHLQGGTDEDEAVNVERRNGARVPVTLEVGLKSQHQFYTAKSANLSLSGIFVAGLVDATPGEWISVEFTVPGAERPIEAVGEVRWVRRVAISAEEPAGCGLRFRALALEDQELIERFLGARAPLLVDAP
jgi:uncharacterized protein (TIGR02266 family)